ncbi:RidA family protein [Paenibacillus senegalensis]|uniref:RidA family protein n=1 Tax=Paenibacillus senegalensis TaxID=1465766 RepID=UPI0002886FCC|nr:RidA family protein [Paenibacillus senegalensis]
MMSKQALGSPAIPPAFGCYSSMIQQGKLLFLSGQGPFDANQQLVGEDISSQTHQTLLNIRSLLEDNGFSMNQVVSSTVYLSDIGDWETVNSIYGQYFSEPYPARTVVGCQLNGMKIEIQCIAAAEG